MPDEIPETSLATEDGKLGLLNLLKGAGLVSGTTEARRMVKQGAVKIDGERVDNERLEIESGTTHIYQVGKRKFARVTLA